MPEFTRARLLGGLWLATVRHHHRRFTRALERPAEAQWQVLSRILAANAGSAVGQRHRFAGIDSVAAFRDRVPLTCYDDLAPAIDEIRAGGQRVLTAEPVVRLLPTSGSSGPCKLIPFTRSLGRDFSRGVGAWITDLARQEPEALRGPGYWSVSPAADTPAVESRVPVGFDDDSAYLGRALAPLVQQVLVGHPALRLVRPLSSFVYATLRCLLAAEDLRLMSLWHPSFFELIWKERDAHWERLVADVRQGTLDPPVPLSPGLSRELSAMARPDPARAEVLEALGPGAPVSEIWPRLRVVSCWGDAAAQGAYRALARALPGVHLQAKGLLATEACITVPFAGLHPVALCSTFVELLGEDGRLVGIGEARADTAYEVVITTSGGLYRYRLGDRVLVDGRVGATPSLTLIGRADKVVDTVGEKLSEAHAEAAIAEAFRRRPRPEFVLLAPENGGYVLFVDSGADEADETAARLERALRENPNYAYARDLGQLAPPRVVRVPASAATAYVSHVHRRGSALGGIKPALLAGQDEWSRILGGADSPNQPERFMNSSG